MGNVGQMVGDELPGEWGAADTSGMVPFFPPDPAEAEGGGER